LLAGAEVNRFSGKTANHDADKVRKEHKAMRESSFPSTLFAYTKSKIWYTGRQEFEGSALDHRSAKPKYISNKKSKAKQKLTSWIRTAERLRRSYTPTQSRDALTDKHVKSNTV